MAAKKPSIDTKLIKELANLLKDTDLDEIELEEGDMRLRLSRVGSADMAPVYTHATVAAPPVAAPAPAPAAAVAPAAAEAPSPAAASGTAITSPMVGTAYLAPSPEAGPFVKVGDTVKTGQTIMIVEAMKTMNQIPASQSGVVEAINVEDGQPVEFGETLITLK